jgi:hypothetical protein
MLVIVSPATTPRAQGQARLVRHADRTIETSSSAASSYSLESTARSRTAREPHQGPCGQRPRGRHDRQTPTAGYLCHAEEWSWSRAARWSRTGRRSAHATLAAQISCRHGRDSRAKASVPNTGALAIVGQAAPTWRHHLPGTGDHVYQGCGTDQFDAGTASSYSPSSYQNPSSRQRGLEYPGW